MLALYMQLCTTETSRLRCRRRALSLPERAGCRPAAEPSGPRLLGRGGDVVGGRAPPGTGRPWVWACTKEGQASPALALRRIGGERAAAKIPASGPSRGQRERPKPRPARAAQAAASASSPSRGQREQPKPWPARAAQAVASASSPSTCEQPKPTQLDGQLVGASGQREQPRHFHTNLLERLRDREWERFFAVVC